MKAGPIAVALVSAAFLGGCATAVDMDAMNSRLDDNAARIGRLEKAQASRPAAPDDTRQRLDAAEKELQGLRREFADNKTLLDSLAERFEDLEAFMKEVTAYIGESRKKGGEVDRTLENLTNKLEAEVRGFGDKLKKFMDSQK